MRAEYEFDYSQAKPNRFAASLRAGAVTVVLEPDIAQVFKTSESVNRFLRSVISAVPRPQQTAKPRKARRKAG